MTRLSVIWFPISLTLGLLLAGSETSAGALYRCVTSTEGTIYTDNPAQLEQCAPITASGAVTSLATVSSGGPPAGAPPDPLPVTQTPSDPTASMLPPGSSPQMIDVPSPSATSNSPPCPVGLNPLNPFSAPPCPTADAASPATITMPPGAIAQP